MRVYVVVEGPTEESFVKNVLAEHFWSRGVYLQARIIGVPGHKGGRCNYARLKGDIVRLLRQESQARCTMMLDYYGLGKGFPGEGAKKGSSLAQVEHMERCIAADIADCLPEHRTDARFLPYFQLHEFEALLFSAPCGVRQRHEPTERSLPAGPQQV